MFSILSMSLRPVCCVLCKASQRCSTIKFHAVVAQQYVASNNSNSRGLAAGSDIRDDQAIVPVFSRQLYQ
jgi:hypothetical protein